MLRSNSKILLGLLFLTLVFALATQQLKAGEVTYIVGTCMSGKTFTTLQAALDATPSPEVVEVCPGSYHEQIVITKPVTLEGIASGGADKAIILPPKGGLIINAVGSVAAQVLVLATTGVSIQNLAIDGTGNNLTGDRDPMPGIFFEESSGTINGIHLEGQENASGSGSTGTGVGILLEGSSTKPSVTVENCFIQSFDHTGILASNSSGSELTITIKDNFVTIKDSSLAGQAILGLALNEGTTATVTGNYIYGNANTAIEFSGGGGTVSGNTIVSSGGGFGVLVFKDGAMSFSSNNVFAGGSSGVGFFFAGPTKSLEVQGNTIVFANDAIELNCFNTNGKVHSNTILYAQVGVDQLPSGVSSSNTYYDVATQTTTCP